MSLLALFFAGQQFSQLSKLDYISFIISFFIIYLASFYLKTLTKSSKLNNTVIFLIKTKKFKKWRRQKLQLKKCFCKLFN